MGELNKGRFVLVAEVAEVTRSSVDTVRRWARDGVLPPPVRLGKRLMWERTSIEEFLARGGQRVEK